MWASAPTNVSKTMFGRTILSALSNIVHHWRIRRGAVISTATCFAILLRGNCYRWERCLHAGGAVVQICRGISVCWPQCFSTGSFCGTAVQSDPHPAPLFAHFFWQDRKSRPAERRLRCRRIQQQSGANRNAKIPPVRSERRDSASIFYSAAAQMSCTCAPVPESTSFSRSAASVCSPPKSIS